MKFTSRSRKRTQYPSKSCAGRAGSTPLNSHANVPVNKSAAETTAVSQFSDAATERRDALDARSGGNRAEVSQMLSSH